MSSVIAIHPDFFNLLKYKDQELVDLYIALRTFVLSHYSESVELLYHTHALTSVYSVSEKMGDGFCMIPIYTAHLNLGFHKGTLLDDPHKLLQGTGKLIRHIPITNKKDYRNPKVKKLVKAAINLAIEDMDKPTKSKRKTISKIKISK